MRRGRRGGMFWVLILLLLVAAAMCSCEKAPINSEVEGHWRVQSIENRAGKQLPCENLFYSIQLQVVELTQKPSTGKVPHLVGRVSYPEKGSMRLSDFYRSAGWKDNGEKVCVEDLHPYGLPSLDTQLRIVKAKGGNLVLETDSTTIRLKKF